jgi:hemolysin III
VSGRVATAAGLKPRLRGLSHAAAFLAAVPLGVLLIVEAETSLGRLAAVVFAASVVTMFGASALYHAPNWPEGPRRWLRRIDHAGIYGLIAGTYTAFGLLVLKGNWRPVVLSSSGRERSRRSSSSSPGSTLRSGSPLTDLPAASR